MHAAQGPSGPAIRQHVRVACEDVAAAVRIEGTEEWMQVPVGDLSLGGVFVLTDRFIAEGTRVDAGLAFPSGIRLFFLAEVARAVPASARTPAGLGLQFFESTPENMRALGRELEPRMQAVPPPPPGGPAAGTGAKGAPAGGGLELTTSIYDRLRLPPDYDAVTLGQALERLIASVEASVDSIRPGQQRDQALVFKQTLERMRPLCQDPLKRVAYDFNHGYVRVEERIADAAAGRGPPLLRLQEVWKRIFPEEVREARRLFAESRQGGPAAAQQLVEARALDPFNAQLHVQAHAPATPSPAPPAASPPPAANPYGAPPPAVSPNPFAHTTASPASSDEEELPLVDPDDFFGGPKR